VVSVPRRWGGQALKTKRANPQPQILTCRFFMRKLNFLKNFGKTNRDELISPADEKQEIYP
jgi:hypothetical protein